VRNGSWKKLGVEVHPGVHVQNIRAHEVVLPNETIRAGTLIWAAGVTASPLAGKLGVETDRGGRVKVLPDLSLPDHPEVFVLGDMAALIDKKGQIVPGLCPSALQMGRHAAKLIARELESGHKQLADREAFVYCDKGTMATIGSFGGRRDGRPASFLGVSGLARVAEHSSGFSDRVPQQVLGSDPVDLFVSHL